MNFLAISEGTMLDTHVHIITALVAFVLFFISMKTYFKIKKQKFLYVCFAFLFYSIKEIIVVLDIFYFQSPVAVSVSHFLNLAILLLFFIGVVK